MSKCGMVSIARGGSEVFLSLRDIWDENGGKLPRTVSKITREPRRSVTATTPAKPRLELPKQQRVAKPKSEAVEIKTGDWFGKLQSLAAKK